MRWCAKFSSAYLEIFCIVYILVSMYVRDKAGVSQKAREGAFNDRRCFKKDNVEDGGNWIGWTIASPPVCLCRTCRWTSAAGIAGGEGGAGATRYRNERQYASDE